MLIRQPATAFCENYANDEYGYLIDKITLRTESRYLNMELVPHFRNGPVTIIRKGPYSFINIHSEALNRHEPLIDQVYRILQNLSHSYVLSSKVLEITETKISSLKRFFKLTIVEVAFDFLNGYTPFQITDATEFYYYKNSIYSNDFYRTFNDYGIASETFRSLLCIYNRSLKGGFGVPVTRMEFRVSKPNVKCVFFNYLKYPMDKYVKKVSPKLAQILSSSVSLSAIDFDLEKLDKTHPALSRILRLAGWK